MIRPRGFLIAVVLGVMAILMTLVAALQYTQMARRTASVLMEAQYLAERSADSLEAQLEANLEGDLPAGVDRLTFADDDVTEATAGQDPIGSYDRQSLVIDADIYFRGARNYGAGIFGEMDQMVVGNPEDYRVEEKLRKRKRLLPPQALRVEGQPTSRNPNLDVFKRNRYQAVMAAGFPYAAFAPGNNSSVSFEKVGTWAVPAIGQLDEASDNPLSLGSGYAPYVGAGGDVRVDDFVYGQVYTRRGQAQVSGGALIFEGYLPYERWAKQSYVELMRSSIENAFSSLDAVLTDKTGVVFGTLNLVDTMNLIIYGRMPSNFLTYEAASKWWFFLLPSIKNVGSVLDFRLHVPMPADTQLAGSSTFEVGVPLAEMAALSESNQKLEDQLLPAGTPKEEEKWNENTRGLVPELAWAAKEYQRLQGEMETLEQQRSQLEDQIDRLGDGRAKDAKERELARVQSQINSKQTEVEAQQSEVERLDKAVQRKQDTIDANNDRIEAITSSLKSFAQGWLEGDPGGPSQMTEFILSHKKFGEVPTGKETAGAQPTSDTKANRADDDDNSSIMSKDGMMLYSYNALMVRLLAQLVDIIENAVMSLPFTKVKINLGFKTIKLKFLNVAKLPEWMAGVGASMVEALKNLVVYEVSLVYLDGINLKKINGSDFHILDTFNVPPGRTFKLQGDMTIEGDLWLQQGSSMEITGDLRLKDPGGGDLMQPHGRIYLEEGCSLLVGGDLHGKGDKFLGSVVACGPMEKNLGINCAILCKGDVNLPHGTGGGVTLAELGGWLRADKGRQTFEILLHEWCPNLSKCSSYLGPFYKRLPYFGKHPTILRYVLPYGPLYPTYETIDKNLNVPILRVLSEIFCMHLNMVLGENFTTVTIWWAISGEQAAVMPKSASGAFKEAIEPFLDEVIAAVSWVDKHAVDDLLGGVLDGTLETLQDPSLIAESVVPLAAMAFNPDPTGATTDVIAEVVNKVMGDNSGSGKSEKAADELKLVSRVPGGADYNILKPFWGAINEVQNAVNGLSLVSGLDPSESQLRESSHALLVECPGVFVYGGRSLQLGPRTWTDTPSVRAVGCFVSGGPITANVRYTIGSLLSFDGDIRGRELYYTPYFTRASLYQPKQLKRGGTRLGANTDLWENAVNLKYGKALDTDTAVDIPSSQVFFSAGRGWGP